QIELLCLTNDGPVMFKGRARYDSSGEQIEVDLSSPASAGLKGSQAIITFPTAGAPRMTAQIIHADGNHLSLISPKLRPRDKRLYPRLYGNIPLHYRAHRAEEGELAVHRWLAGSTHDGPQVPLRSPEPFMNFSVSGVCFEDSIGYDKDTLLLLEFGVGESGERWRATGRIIRSDELPEGDTPLHQIAVNFETLPDEAMEALSEFTLTIQEALL
ncbi:MAG: hypothetical protein ACI8S6_005284, partial [Myxococcota bacterium]